MAKRCRPDQALIWQTRKKKVTIEKIFPVPKKQILPKK